MKIMRAQEVIPLLLISYIYFFIVPTIYHLKPSPEQWGGCLDLNFSGGIYGFYLIFGYLIKRFEDKINGISKNMALSLSLITILIMTMTQLYRSYHVWYDFCLLPIASIFIFIYFKDLKFQFSLASRISDCAFGIYLIHALFVAVILKYRLLHSIAVDELRIIIFTILLFVLSFVSVILIKKLPYLNKLLVR